MEGFRETGDRRKGEMKEKAVLEIEGRKGRSKIVKVKPRARERKSW